MNKFRNNNSNRPPFNLDQQRQQQFQQFQQAQQAQQFHHMMQQQHQQMMGGPQMSKYSKKKKTLNFIQLFDLFWLNRIKNLLVFGAIDEYNYFIYSVLKSILIVNCFL